MRALIVLFSFCMCVINAQAHITITPDSVVEYETSPFEAGFEMIEERYFEKKKQFSLKLLRYLHNLHAEDISTIRDTACINFIVNKNGRVDSVWMLKHSSFKFKNTFKFIKAYDFKGPLIEYYSSPPGTIRFPYLVKLKLRRDELTQHLLVYFDFESLRKK